VTGSAGGALRDWWALPLARLAGPPGPADSALIGSRLRLTRHLVDLGLALPPAGP
jgi:hypothetical protein